MLTFIGLGLFDEDDISIKGLQAIKNADVVYVEFYTSKLVGSTLQQLQKLYEKELHLLSRDEIELTPEKRLLRDARHRNVVFLTGGDAMISTTHVDLRIRAHDQGIQTRLVHGASIVTAVCGLTGLQNYRFGKSATISFPYKTISAAPYNTVMMNLRNDLHTLLFLDIHDELMSLHQGIELLIHSEHERGKNQLTSMLGVGIARAGSPSPTIKADTLGRLKDYDFGPPLHVLVIPASLHFMEEAALERFAGARHG